MDELSMMSGSHGNNPVDTGSGEKTFAHEVYLFDADEATVFSEFKNKDDVVVVTGWEGKTLEANKVILFGHVGPIKKATVTSGGKGTVYFANLD